MLDRSSRKYQDDAKRMRFWVRYSRNTVFNFIYFITRQDWMGVILKRQLRFKRAMINTTHTPYNKLSKEGSNPGPWILFLCFITSTGMQDSDS